MSSEWVPFGLDAEAEAQYRVLVPGVPAWLREPLLEWLSSRWATGNGNRDYLNAGPMLTFQNALRVDLGVRSGSPIVSGEAIRQTLRGLLDIDLRRMVDDVLATSFSRVTGATAVLEIVLAQAQSAYAVGDRMGKIGLVDRVPEGVRTTIEGVFQVGGSAGPLLARAWAHVHGLEKNDTAGYADAVRAVEAAAIPVVQPQNREATLGTVIKQMHDQGDWRLPLREHNHAPSSEMIVQMLRTLFRGHRDRHGNLDYSDVTHEEARAAVVLAATLVDWFTSGAIARRPAEQDASS